MTAAILIATLGVVAFGAFVMHRLDQFTEKNITPPSPQIRACDVLLFGPPNMVEPMLCTLQRQGLTCCRADSPQVPAGTRFEAVLAVSEDDMQNLLLCHEAGHASPGAFLVARCNHLSCQTVFTDAHIHAVPCAEPEAFLREMGGCFHFDT